MGRGGPRGWARQAGPGVRRGGRRARPRRPAHGVSGRSLLAPRRDADTMRGSAPVLPTARPPVGLPASEHAASFLFRICSRQVLPSANGATPHAPSIPRPLSFGQAAPILCSCSSSVGWSLSSPIILSIPARNVVLVVIVVGVASKGLPNDSEARGKELEFGLLRPQNGASQPMSVTSRQGVLSLPSEHTHQLNTVRSRSIQT